MPSKGQGKIWSPYSSLIDYIQSHQCEQDLIFLHKFVLRTQNISINAIVPSQSSDDFVDMSTPSLSFFFFFYISVTSLSYLYSFWKRIVRSIITFSEWLVIFAKKSLDKDPMDMLQRCSIMNGSSASSIPPYSWLDHFLNTLLAWAKHIHDLMNEHQTGLRGIRIESNLSTSRLKTYTK